MQRNLLRHTIAIQIQLRRCLSFCPLRYIKYHTRIGQNVCSFDVLAIRPAKRKPHTYGWITIVNVIISVMNMKRRVAVELQIHRQNRIGDSMGTHVKLPKYPRHPLIRHKMRLIGICQIIDLAAAPFRHIRQIFLQLCIGIRCVICAPLTGNVIPARCHDAFRLNAAKYTAGRSPKFTHGIDPVI